MEKSLEEKVEELWNREQIKVTHLRIRRVHPAP